MWTVHEQQKCCTTDLPLSKQIEKLEQDYTVLNDAWLHDKQRINVLHDRVAELETRLKSEKKVSVRVYNLWREAQAQAHNVYSSVNHWELALWDVRKELDDAHKKVSFFENQVNSLTTKLQQANEALSRISNFVNSNVLEKADDGQTDKP